MEQQSDPPKKTLRVIMYSAMPYEVVAFKRALSNYHDDRDNLDVVYLSSPLNTNTVSLSMDAQVVSLFALDRADNELVEQLHSNGVRLIVLRYPGVSSVDFEKASSMGIQIASASIHASTSMGEYAVGLMLTLNRKIHLAYNRVRDGNLSLNGMVGFEMMGKTAGIIGTGKVGIVVAKILHGFGCNILAYDTQEHEKITSYGGKYVSVAELLEKSDIVTLHAPLVPATHHMLRQETMRRCKRGVYIVNISRGALIDTKAAIEYLRSGHIGGLAMDVYEGESDLFFRDRTGEVLDEDFQLLKSMPNVLMTGHQSSLTTSALGRIAKACVKSMIQFYRGESLQYKYNGEDRS